MPQIYQLDLSGGSGSPFRALSVGSVIFDANYSALRLHAIFTFQMGANTNQPQPSSQGDGTSSFTTIPLNKTFTRPPMFSACQTNGTIVQSNPFFAPTTRWSPSGLLNVGGVVLVTTVDQLRAGNWSPSAFNVAVAVYDKGVFG